MPWAITAVAMTRRAALRSEATHGLVTAPVSERVSALLKIAEMILCDGGDEEERTQCARAAAAILRLSGLVCHAEHGWRRSRSWRSGPGTTHDGAYYQMPGVHGWFDHHYRVDVPATVRDGPRRLYVSEPYALSEGDLSALLELTRDYAIAIDGHSLHYPGATLRITFERRR